MDNNLVSIIMPAYKAQAYIGQSIESVQAQTYRDWELLIADDCSPDNTKEVVANYAAKDPRIRLLSLEKNGGPARARNAALASASGRWIAFLDSDDVWLPTKLQRCLEHAQSNHAPLVYTAFRRISAYGGKVGQLIKVPPSLSYKQLLGNTAIATSTVLIDRAITGDFRMRVTYYDDFDCWLQILKKHGPAIGLDEDLMRYRVMDQSVSRNKKNSAKQVWLAYRNLENMGRVQSAWYFSRYAFNAFLKYFRF